MSSIVLGLECPNEYLKAPRESQWYSICCVIWK